MRKFAFLSNLLLFFGFSYVVTAEAQDSQKLVEFKSPLKFEMKQAAPFNHDRKCARFVDGSVHNEDGPGKQSCTFCANIPASLSFEKENAWREAKGNLLS